MMYVKKAADKADWFILHHIDGRVEEGALPDIAVKYTVANKQLTMNGYKQDGASGNGLHPQFNL